jgi:hypothetical protein
MPMTPQEYEKQLQVDMGQFFADPYGFVMYAFEWDKAPLKDFVGPDKWQIELMEDIRQQVLANNFDGKTPVDAIRESVTSGHGVGKSAVTAWLTLWIMSTRPHAKGVVTANTGDQLKTKTWAELGKWKRQCITGHWFEYNNTKGNMNMYHKAYKESWRVDAQTCREENSESFAGLHAANSSPFYIFDEASAVPDKIWEVAEGGLTDGEPFWFVFGNPTRNTGRFRECFRKFRGRWRNYKVDSRSARMTNKKLINEWIADYGIDSDFVKVRVLGEFPAQSDKQYISSEILEVSAQRTAVEDDRMSPLIWGIDFGRSGSDPTVIRGRRGRDGRPFAAIKIKERNSMKLCAIISTKIAEASMNPFMRPDAIFGDGGGLGGPIIDQLNKLGHNVIEVNNAAIADDSEHFSNKRAEVAFRCKEWVLNGGCLDNDELLKEDLAAVEAEHDRKDRLLMMSKDKIKDILGRSTDDGDAFRLTFAYHVAPKSGLFEEMNKNYAKVKLGRENMLGFASESGVGMRNRCAT